MNNNKEITIIGATGNLGTPITRFLTKFGFKVTVVARNLKKAERLFGKIDSVKIVYADLTDTNSLKEALKDTKFLYLNLSTMTTDVNIPFAEEREGVENIVKSVNRNSIQQIIAISGLGAFQKNMVPEKYEFAPNKIRSQGHKILKESGIPYTLLHCTWFTDSFILYQRKGAYAAIGNNNLPIYFINAYDYSIQLANAIGNKSAYNKEYPIQGKKGIKHIEAAKEFLNVYSPNVKVQELPLGIINILSLFKKEMKVVKAMAKYFKHSKELFQAEEYGTYKDLGEPKLSLQEYTEKLILEKIYN